MQLLLWDERLVPESPAKLDLHIVGVERAEPYN